MLAISNSPTRTHRAPTDTALAHRLFGANCGPNALAALLSLDVIDVMCHFTHFPDVPHTNIPKMKEVLDRASIDYEPGSDVPRSGLVLIEVLGSWNAHPASQRWTPRLTHWVALSEGYVFDVNVGEWKAWDDWKAVYAPQLVERKRGGTGWRIKRSYAIKHREVDARSAFPGCAFGWSARH